MLLYALAVLFCLAQPIPETQADTGGVRLAQSGKKAGDDNWRRTGERVVSWGYEPTRVKIRGNSVLVPVTLVNGNHEVEMHFLLDTGASVTAMSTEVAKRLNVDLKQTRKTRVGVAGGGSIDARVVRMSRLTVGPHTKREMDVLVVGDKACSGGVDGLLGMDVLRGLNYRVDFNKQVIVWE